MATVTVKTEELEGVALDLAVASAVWDGGMDEDFNRFFWEAGFNPSADWSQGGPLIEEHQIELEWIGLDGKAVGWNARHQDVFEFQCAETPLIAAMRAIVAAELGDTVDIPEELMK